jgi:hypothetical protein
MRQRDQINRISNKYFDHIDGDLYNENFHLISDYLQYILYIERSPVDNIVDELSTYIETMNLGN